MRRNQGAQLAKIANALGAKVELSVSDSLEAGPPSTANSNRASPAQTSLGAAPSPETLRLLRAFNSIKDREVRLIVLTFVETTAGQVRTRRHRFRGARSELAGR